MNNNNNTKHLQEDEIDLRELFKIIWNKRVFIVLFTFVVTIISGTYSFMKTPVYEGKALIELASYNTGLNKKNYLQNSKDLNKKLNTIFIDTKKEAPFTKINIPKGFTNFIEINIEEKSNELILSEFNKVLFYIKTIDKKIFHLRDKKIKKEIENLNLSIKRVTETNIPNVSKKIDLEKESIKVYKEELFKLNEYLEKVKKSDYSLLLLKQNEKSSLFKLIKNDELTLLALENSLHDLKTIKLRSLNDKLLLLEESLFDENSNETKIVGEFILTDYPTKPKKKLIIVVSFITGFIFSIFIVFFLNLIKTFKEEKND